MEEASVQKRIDVEGLKEASSWTEAAAVFSNEELRVVLRSKKAKTPRNIISEGRRVGLKRRTETRAAIALRFHAAIAPAMPAPLAFPATATAGAARLDCATRSRDSARSQRY